MPGLGDALFRVPGVEDELRIAANYASDEYVFANARRLERRLDELGVPYGHCPEVAPTDEIRALQHAADAAAGSGSAIRDTRAAAFVQAYGRRLETAEARAALWALGVRSCFYRIACGATHAHPFRSARGAG